MDCFVARAPRNDDVAPPCAPSAKQHIAETARRAVRACAPCAICPSCQSVACTLACGVGQITSMFSRIPPRQEGRTRRHERGAGCGGRFGDARRAALEADGGAVWWGPDAGAKFLRSKLLRDDGGKRARSPGRARRKPLKPLRREGRVISATPVVTTLCFLPMHRGRGCGEHPAFPAPSVFERDNILARPGRIASRERGFVFVSAFLSWPILRDACYAKLLTTRASCVHEVQILMVRSASSRVSNHEAPDRSVAVALPSSSREDAAL
jgi:hypothetical protein